MEGRVESGKEEEENSARGTSISSDQYPCSVSSRGVRLRPTTFFPHSFNARLLSINLTVWWYQRGEGGSEAEAEGEGEDIEKTQAEWQEAKILNS